MLSYAQNAVPYTYILNQCKKDSFLVQNQLKFEMAWMNKSSLYVLVALSFIILKVNAKETCVEVRVRADHFQQALSKRFEKEERIYSSSSFQSNYNKLATSIEASGSYLGLSLGAKSSYENVILSQKQFSENYKENKKDIQTFDSNFFQIIRKITTTVTIDGTSKSTDVREYTDSTSKGNPDTQVELSKRGTDYIRREFGTGSGKISGHQYTETSCIEDLIWQQSNDVNCWAGCGSKGLCPSVCGARGYCCREGYDGCPPEAAKASPKYHSCVKNIPKHLQKSWKCKCISPNSGAPNNGITCDFSAASKPDFGNSPKFHCGYWQTCRSLNIIDGAEVGMTNYDDLDSEREDIVNAKFMVRALKCNPDYCDGHDDPPSYSSWCI